MVPLDGATYDFLFVAIGSIALSCIISEIKRSEILVENRKIIPP